MKPILISLATTALLLSAPAYAQDVAADIPENLSDCEVLMMRFVEDETGNGGMDISTYGPAEDYIASVYDAEDGHLTQMRNDPIRALMCQRDDVLPIEADYPLLATGIPFILSQDFDATETDSLTMFWRKGYFDYVYKGHPLSEESQTDLETRLAAFSSRNKDLPGVHNSVRGPQIVSTVEVGKPVETVETVETVEEITLLEAPEAIIEIDGSQPDSLLDIGISESNTNETAQPDIVVIETDEE